MEDIIKQRLFEHFAPTYLDIHDDSDQHMGHIGSQGGAKHFTVSISSSIFVDKSRIQCHRMIYALLDDLIPHKIHALRIKII